MFIKITVDSNTSLRAKLFYMAFFFAANIAIGSGLLYGATKIVKLAWGT